MTPDDSIRSAELFEGDDEFEELNGVFSKDPFEQARAFTFSGREHNRLFTKGPDRYAYSHFSTGLGFDYDARSVASADLNRDGAPDLIIANRQGQPLQVLYNQLPGGRHAVSIQLKNRAPNHRSIGAQITVSCDDISVLQQVTAGNGYLTQASSVLHFGLGDCEANPSVSVRWPDGGSDTVTVPLDSLSTLRRGEGVTSSVPHLKRATP